MKAKDLTTEAIQEKMNAYLSKGIDNMWPFEREHLLELTQELFNRSKYHNQ